MKANLYQYQNRLRLITRISLPSTPPDLEGRNGLHIQPSLTSGLLCTAPAAAMEADAMDKATPAMLFTCLAAPWLLIFNALVADHSTVPEKQAGIQHKWLSRVVQTSKSIQSGLAHVAGKLNTSPRTVCDLPWLTTLTAMLSKPAPQAATGQAFRKASPTIDYMWVFRVALTSASVYISTIPILSTMRPPNIIYRKIFRCLLPRTLRPWEADRLFNSEKDLAKAMRVCRVTYWCFRRYVRLVRDRAFSEDEAAGTDLRVAKTRSVARWERGVYLYGQGLVDLLQATLSETHYTVNTITLVQNSRIGALDTILSTYLVSIFARDVQLDSPRAHLQPFRSQRDRRTLCCGPFRVWMRPRPDADGGVIVPEGAIRSVHDEYGATSLGATAWTNTTTMGFPLGRLTADYSVTLNQGASAGSLGTVDYNTAAALPLQSFGWSSSGGGLSEVSMGSDVGRVQDLWAEETDQNVDDQFLMAPDPDEDVEHDQGAIDNLMAPRVTIPPTRTVRVGGHHASDEDGSGTS